MGTMIREEVFFVKGKEEKDEKGEKYKLSRKNT